MDIFPCYCYNYFCTNLITSIYIIIFRTSYLPLYMPYTYFNPCSYMDFWVVSSFLLSWTILKWTLLYIYRFANLFISISIWSAIAMLEDTPILKINMYFQIIPSERKIVTNLYFFLPTESPHLFRILFYHALISSFWSLEG